MFLLIFTYSHLSVSENTLVTALTLTTVCSMFQDKIYAKSNIVLKEHIYNIYFKRIYINAHKYMNKHIGSPRK